ncbi:hypothetical protein KUF71_006197 [Frankliniella fusca]|uniref:Uncharacterized protein n=1 Tax=Frankliniella fusca TaxID=407009 RepID=A0AAE1H874_9NEOP|nr:hypothetical protein KUF71_006197 [Frankliniella fusca]
MMSSPDGSHHSEKKSQKRKKSHRRIGPKRKGQRLRKQADSSGASSCATLSSKSEKTLSSTDSILADIDFDSDLEIDIESVVNEVANDDGFNNVDESGTEMSGRFSATTRSETSQHSIEPFDEDSKQNIEIVSHEHKEICNVETEVEVEAIQIVDEGSIPELCSNTISVVSHETQQFFNLETEVEVEATQMDPISPILGKGLKRRRPRLTMRPNKSNVRSENIEKASTSYQGPEPLAVKTTVVEKNFPSSQSAQASGQDNDNDNNSDMLQCVATC